MYAVIRHYQFNPKDSAEVDRLIREEFVPLVKKAPGFERSTGWIVARVRAPPSASLGTKPARRNRCG